MVGLDLSLTSTGYAIGENGRARPGLLVPPDGRNRGVRRLAWVRDAVLELAASAELVAIEGYSFSSKFSHAHALGELGGVVRLALAEAGAVMVEVPPKCVKLFASGKGNASKDEVLVAAVKRLGYGGHSKDEADALWLLMMAGAHYGDSATNEHGRRALAAIAWPRLRATSPIHPKASA